MARLGDIEPLPKPIDVELRNHVDAYLQTPQWSILSQDIYGEAATAQVEHRVVYSTPDRFAALAFLEANGYVEAETERQYRLYDETCGECGAYVLPDTRPYPSEGWHDGREYRYFDGRLQIARVRCPRHPFDTEGEARALGAAGLL